MKKIVSVVLVVIMVLSLSVCYADIDLSKYSGASVTEFDTMGNSIIGAIQVGATVVAVAMLLFVGIKFMMAAPAEKANLKGALIPYIVGAVLIFAAIPLLGIIQKFSSNI